MAHSQQNTSRKPATKFAQLRKKLLKLLPGNRGKQQAAIHHAQRGHHQRHS